MVVANLLKRDALKRVGGLKVEEKKRVARANTRDRGVSDGVHRKAIRASSLSRIEFVTLIDPVSGSHVYQSNGNGVLHVINLMQVLLVKKTRSRNNYNL